MINNLHFFRMEKCVIRGDGADCLPPRCRSVWPMLNCQKPGGSLRMESIIDVIRHGPSGDCGTGSKKSRKSG